MQSSTKGTTPMEYALVWFIQFCRDKYQPIINPFYYYLKEDHRRNTANTCAYCMEPKSLPEVEVYYVTCLTVINFA